MKLTGRMNSIHLQHQLVRTKEKNSQHVFTTLKNKQSRTFTMAPSVVNMLKKVKVQQAEWKLMHGQLFQNKDNLVFTSEIGNHLCCHTMYVHFKKIMKEMGLQQVRFHDLRHH